MGKNKRKVKHKIPFDTVFKPDPYGDVEDTRPVELRRGRRGRPNKSIPWKVIKDARA